MTQYTQLLRHRPNLIRFCVKLTCNHHDAEDLSQDVFFRAFKALEAGTYTDEGKSLSWLFTIARNTFINNFRSRKARQSLHPSRFETVTHNDALQKLAVEEIRGKIGRLKRIYSEPLLLRGDDYSYEETAELLRKPLGTIQSRIFEGRKMLSRMRD